MQIVIEIDDKTYTDIKKGKIYSSYRDVPQESVSAIANGTLLPKGHGRLIDADELYLDIQTDEEMRLGEHLKWVKDRFDTAPTIIEADKAGEEE